jgi:HNH endonuclease
MKPMHPCRKCGVLFDTHHCVPCNRANSKKWRTSNPDAMKSLQKKWYVDNRDRVKKASHFWRAGNPFFGRSEEARVKRAATQAKWQAANLELRRIANHNRREKESGGKLSKGLIYKLLRLQRGRCAVCCCDLVKAKYHLDHIDPISRGGKNEDRNIQLLCQPCNQTKHAKDPVDFMRSRGFLL